MKFALLSILALLALAPKSSFAEPTHYGISSDEMMSEEECVERAQEFAMQQGLTLEQWGPSDFGFIGGDSRHSSGRVYYMDGVCHIQAE